MTTVPPTIASSLGNDPAKLSALSQHHESFGNWTDALAALHSGTALVAAHGGVPPQSEDFVRGALGRAIQGEHFDPMAELGNLAQEQPQAEATPTTQEATTPPPPAPSFHVQGHVTKEALTAIDLAKEYLGAPYVWGGENPSGFDCSGLLQYVWSKQGITIPRTTYDQFKAGTAVPKAQLQPGDAVFFTGSDAKNGLPGHVGMYLGGGKFIEAPHTGAVVRISNLQGRTDYAGARRFS